MTKQRTATEVFQSHSAYRLDGDTESDIKQNYADDVVLLTGTGVFKGHDGVRESTSQLDGYVGDASFRYNHTLVEGDYAFLEWTAQGSNIKVLDGADGFVIKNGKIVSQTIHYSVTKK